MKYIKGTDTTNIIKCNHCKSIIEYDDNDTYIEKGISYSFESTENYEVVRVFICCPCCGDKINVGELKK